MPATPSATGISASTPKRIIFDAGAMYKSWDSSPVPLGATRGGCVFEYDREDRDIEVDGTKGATKGLVRNIRSDCKLTVSFLEIFQIQLRELFRQVTGDPSDSFHNTWVPDVSIADADYATNIALVATVSGGVQGCVLVLKNALSRGPWNITTEDRNEGVLGPVVFQAHYDPAAPATCPFEVRWPVGAS